jgi:hypothetical protein
MADPQLLGSDIGGLLADAMFALVPLCVATINPEVQRHDDEGGG